MKLIKLTKQFQKRLKWKDIDEKAKTLLELYYRRRKRRKRRRRRRRSRRIRGRNSHSLVLLPSIQDRFFNWP
jgi:hypothetical protein